VKPEIWEMTWFRVCSSLLIAGSLAGTLRLVERRKYKRRLAILQTQHAIERERLRIAQDMHDHVGAMLTQVSQISDLGQSGAGGAGAAPGHFEKIGGQARTAVQALDEIVWATNPKNDNLPQFAEYVCRFADEFFESSTVRCWQEVPTTLPKLMLAADVRHDLFLAVKEALHNVVKHSGATEAWLRLTLDQAEVRLEIEDNGHGFDQAKVGSGGDGLENMRARMAQCHGRVEFTTAPGKGTKVRFVFPLPEQS
jgi:signal transduction histidine kinase